MEVSLPLGITGTYPLITFIRERDTTKVLPTQFQGSETRSIKLWTFGFVKMELVLHTNAEVVLRISRLALGVENWDKR